MRYLLLPSTVDHEVCSPKLSYLTFGLNMLKVKFLEYVRELCLQVDSGP